MTADEKHTKSPEQLTTTIAVPKPVDAPAPAAVLENALSLTSIPAFATNPFVATPLTNGFMSYADQLAFLSTHLLFNQALLSATTALNQINSQDKPTLNTTTNDLFKMPYFQSSENTQIRPSNENLLANNRTVDVQNEMSSTDEPYLGKSRRRRHPRRKLPPLPDTIEVNKLDGAVIRHCTNCGVIGHDRRNCQKTRFDKSGTPPSPFSSLQ
jgi:hypothetical protein